MIWATAIPGPAVCGCVQKALGSCCPRLGRGSWCGVPVIILLPLATHLPATGGGWGCPRGKWDTAPLLSPKAAGHLGANPGGPPVSNCLQQPLPSTAPGHDVMTGCP